MTVEWLQPLDRRFGTDDQLPGWLFWTYVGISMSLVAMAGLMSGLTLGLMSLDEVDLEVLKRSGTEQEKKHARRIMPVIENEHFLLVTLLLFNALSTEALPVFLDKLVDPVTAVVLSVTVVLVIGEILPQAVCRSYGLQVGSYSALFVRLLMALSSPITWPIGKLLDWLLGDEHTALFRRAQLKALVGLHSSAEGLGGNLSADEISIITGALDLTSKTAWTALTPIDKVFMLASDRRLDEATLQEILVSGHSRLPVHQPADRHKLLGLILVKELVLVDPDEGLTAGQLVSRNLPRLPADTPLYQLLRLFEAGGSHMVALTKPPARPSQEAQDGPGSRSGSSTAGPARSSSLTPGQPAAPLHRIKSGVIKAGDSMLYIEAEQCISPLSPQRPASWGLGPSSPVRGEGGGGVSAQELWGAGVREGDPVGIITIEDVIEELLQQEIIDETDQYVDNLQATRVDAYALTTSLPPRLRKAYAQQFTPRVGRLVVHHPTQHHHVTGSWKGLSVLKQQQMAPRGAYSNPTTPLAGTPLGGTTPLGCSPDSSSHPSPLSSAAGGSGNFGGVFRHSRLSGEHQQQQLHMQQVPEQQQLQLQLGHGNVSSSINRSNSHEGHPGIHVRHPVPGLRLGQQPHSEELLSAEAMMRRHSADSTMLNSIRAEGLLGGGHSWGSNQQPVFNSSLLQRGQSVDRQQQQGAGITAAAKTAALAAATGYAAQQDQQQPAQAAADTGNSSGSSSGGPTASKPPAAAPGVVMRGVSQAHVSGANEAGSSASGGDGCGFGSYMNVDELQQPLLHSSNNDSGPEDDE